MLSLPSFYEQDFVADERSATAEILSTTTEIGLSFFSTLEAHFLMAMDGQRSHVKNYSIQEQCTMLRKRLNSTISSLILSDSPNIKDERLKDFPNSSKHKVAAWLQVSRSCVSILLFFFILIIGYYMSLRLTF